MEVKDLVLALMPPALAIVTEWVGFPDEKYLHNRSHERQTPDQLSDDQVTTVHQMSVGAVSMSSIAPTLISFVLTSFTLFSFGSNPLWPDLGAVFIAMVAAMALVRMLSHSGPIEVATKKLKKLIRSKKNASITVYSTWTLAKAIHVSIYGVNAILMVVAVIMFLLVSV